MIRKSQFVVCSNSPGPGSCGKPGHVNTGFSPCCGGAIAGGVGGSEGGTAGRAGPVGAPAADAGAGGASRGMPGGIEGAVGCIPSGICIVSGARGEGCGSGDGVPATEVPPRIPPVLTTVPPPPATCPPGASAVPPGLKAEMYPEANMAIRLPAIKIVAAAKMSFTISRTTLIPYIFFTWRANKYDRHIGGET
jgi:hypothetical protein